MTPIGTTSANTVPGENPVLPQETVATAKNDGFSLLLSQETEGASLSLQSAAVDGKVEKTAIAKKSAAEGNSLADHTGDINYLAACMAVIQPLQALPESESPVVLNSASEAESGSDTAEKGSVKGAELNGATVANAPIGPAAFDSLGVTNPVPGAAITENGAAQDLEAYTATGAEVSVEKPADINTADIGTVESGGANAPTEDQGTCEEVLPDTAIMIPDPSGDLEKQGTSGGIEATTAMVVNASVGKAVSTIAMESAPNTFASLNTSSIFNVLNAANLSGAVALNGENGPQPPISNTSGMPVATQRESMHPVHAQTETRMTLSEKSDTFVSQNASSGKVDASKLAASDSHERKFDNGEDTTSNGSNLFAPSLSSTVRNVDSSSKFQLESTAKNAFHQNISAIYDHTSEAIGRMRSDGKEGVEVRLRLHDGQELTIQLRMNSGEVQPVFKTDSSDLRVALEQNWNQFSAHSADRGIRVAAPVFESGQLGTGDFQQRQDQHFQQQPVILEDEVFQQSVASGTRGTTSLGGDEGTSSESTVLSLFA